MPEKSKGPKRPAADGEQPTSDHGARSVGESPAVNEKKLAPPAPENSDSGGAVGQNRYRGQGGDKSQSGGRRDYGGGYGAGQGQLPYGYESGPDDHGSSANA